MWSVADDDTRIFILGTMHALPPGIDWDRGAVADAVAASDELVTELSPKELAVAGDIFQQLAPRTAPLAMEARLPPGALAQYRAAEAKGGPLGGDALDDWAVMILMAQRAAGEARLSASHGVETTLTAQFRAAGKSIAGLESAHGQLMLFETLAPATQRQLLIRTAEKADAAVDNVRRLTTAWSRGDVATMERMINEDIDTLPDAHRTLLLDRNRRWSAWVSRRMDRPGTVLVAVGAGHLVGDDGLPALLAAKGWTVTRVQ